MEMNYYFSDDFTREEKELLARKAKYFMDRTDLPSEIIRPKEMLYNDENECIGYRYEAPDFSYLSLKELFKKERIESYHVDGHLLLSIAKKVLYVMAELNKKGVFAGFLSLDSIWIHKEKPQKAVAIAYPEYFQVEDIPSSYPWYPSDSKLFEEDFELFDKEKQKKADAKLIYKILTACEKGNAKIPPNSKTQEFSYLFWNILSREWKDYFLHFPEIDVDYKDLMNRITESIEEEKSYMSPDEKRITEEDSVLQTGNEAMKPMAYAEIVILREAEKSAHDISRELYLLQEKIENHPYYTFEQAFVMGDKHPFVRTFRKYKEEFRAQLAHSIRSYSFGEVLLVGAEEMERALKREERPSVLFVLLDGEIKNDAMFTAALKKLIHLKEEWQTELKLIPVQEFKGEGYSRLKEVCK